MSEDKEKSEETHHGSKGPGLFGWLRGRFIAGLVIATPLVVPLFIVIWVVGIIDEKVKPIVRSAIPAQVRNSDLGSTVDTLIAAIPGLGVLIAVIILILLGAFAANWLGRLVIRTSERIAERVPIVSTLYMPIRQLVEIFSDKDSTSFKEVVLVEYPKDGTWAVGFLTTNAKDEVANHLNPDYVGVFVPTTPNPTSGFLIFVPGDKVRRLKMSVEDGAKLIVSAGVVMPKNGDEPSVVITPSDDL